MAVSAGLIIDLPDPASATGETLTAVLLQLSDSDLGPENATIWTAGFDIDPVLFGFRVAATYFNIDYHDRIRPARFSIAAFTDPSLSPFVHIPPPPPLMPMLHTVAQFAHLTPRPPA